MPASNSRSDVEFALWTMVCPITNSLFEEPVVAEDGVTYSKRALLAWFESCKARGLPITSPCTREEISEDTKPNLNMIQAILQYKGEGAAREKARLSAEASGAPVEGGTKCSEPVQSLAALGGMFSLLDGLRELLAETLNGWQPPVIVVVGEESSGKSSVLERLMMTPLLPRDKLICTRLPMR